MITTLPLLCLLGFAAWTLLLVVFGIGSVRVFSVLSGKAPPNAFAADVPHGSERYRRAIRAHLNCVENLPIFAVIVLSGAVAGVAHSVMDVLAIVVLVSRVAQSSVHIASGSNLAVNVRFTFFLAQVISFVWMGALVASTLLA